MSAIHHQVQATKDLPLLRARPVTLQTRSSRHQQEVVSNTTLRYGPIVEAMRAEGLTYQRIGEKLGIAATSASAFLSRYRTGVRQGKI